MKQLGQLVPRGLIIGMSYLFFIYARSKQEAFDNPVTADNSSLSGKTTFNIAVS